MEERGAMARAGVRSALREGRMQARWTSAYLSKDTLYKNNARRYENASFA